MIDVKDLIFLFLFLILLIKYIKLYSAFFEERNNFIQTLSHDLRVSTIAQLRGLELLQNNCSEKDYELISEINNSCKFNFDLITTLLNTYKYENGEQILKYEKCNLYDLILQNLEMMRNSFKEKNIRVYTSMDKKAYVNVDKIAISKAISILLITAINYSKRDSCLMISVSKNNGKLCLNISYKGVFLTEEECQRMFTKNTRFSTVGHGVKMYFCKKIIDFHQGKIKIKNSGDINSFIFTIPEKLAKRCQAPELIEV